jgi:hypothetical protein
MDLALLASLVVLALLDSTSFGTLLIPVWLLLTPGPVRAGRIVLYLSTIAVFYFAVGMAVVLGANAFMSEISAALETEAAQWTQLVLGVGLFALSFRMDSKRKREGGGRLMRWRERALGVEEAEGVGGAATRTRKGSALSLVGLALAAATVEVATMLPYLAAIGLVTTAGIGAVGVTLTMAGYCVVMVLPALVLLAARLFARRVVEPVLVKVNDWMTKHAASTTSWIVGIVGFLLARDAAWRLGLFEGMLNR